MIRGVRLKRKGPRFRILSYASAELDAADPAEAFRCVLREISYRTDAYLVITGTLAGSSFFRTDGMPMTAKDRRSALEFDLSRHILSLPEGAQFQFSSVPDDENPDRVFVNVCVFGREGMDKLAALLTQSHARADEFISPLLCVVPGDGALYLPDLEKDCIFKDGQWHFTKNTSVNTGILESISKFVAIPSDDAEFRFDEFLSCFLVLRFLISKSFTENLPGVRVMSQKLRPSRYKFHLLITILLILFIAGLYFFDAVGIRITRYRESNELKNELANYKRKTSILQSDYKKSEKDRKETERVLKMNPGMTGVLDVMENLTTLLPKDVMATYLRFGDNTIDLTLQTESENPNLQQTLRSMSGWKVNQYNQRRTNDTVTVITIRLVRDDSEGKEGTK